MKWLVLIFLSPPSFVRVRLQDSDVGQKQRQPSGSTGRRCCSGEVSMIWMYVCSRPCPDFILVLNLIFSPRQELHHSFHACPHHGCSSGTEGQPREDRGRFTKGSVFIQSVNRQLFSSECFQVVLLEQRIDSFEPSQISVVRGNKC